MKCSANHLQEYKNAINEYLTSKNIKDFSKYIISIKDDKLHYNKWEYPDILKPENITPKKSVPKYLEFYVRAIIFNIKEISENATLMAPLYFNAKGELVPEGYKDKEYIHNIETVYTQELRTNKWLWIDVSHMQDFNGLIRLNNIHFLKDKPNTTGKIRVIFFYSKK